MAEASGPISNAIKTKLTEALQPTSMRLVNQSSAHSGHFGHDGSAASDSGETHFKLEVVSTRFDKMPMIKRHQLIYSLLDEEIKAGVHALTMSTKTPTEAAR
uniref:Bola-like protein n=1 Tax=Chlamydomonas euryale TaxID=1486919 RepID=A0A7R9YUE1_9CHLO